MIGRKVLLVVLIAVALAIDDSALVKDLPDVKAVYDRPWYSGYLHPEPNRHMHYFFFPSQGNSSTDPLLLWFNGGPGCSSLLGAMYEHGPFIFADAFAILIGNKYSWNTNANVLYLESPAQVGFSYSDGEPPLWTDDNVAQLNLKAVLEFFKKWPEFKTNDFFISGESYAGVYVPTLAEKYLNLNFRIDAYNDDPDVDVGLINLKGFAVGNGCTHPKECGFTTDFPTYLYELLVKLSFVPADLVQKATEACKNQTTNFTGDCATLTDQIDNLAGEGSGMNIYDVYRPCFTEQDMTLSQKYQHFLRRRLPNLKFGEPLPPTETPPCVDGVGIVEFLNFSSVRKALHIPDEVPEYAMCTDESKLKYQSNPQGSYWVYKKLIPKKKYKIVIYSGDTDPAVPVTGSLDWINLIREELQLATVEYWRPWYVNYDAGKQNAGNVWRLKGLSFVTYRGVGHMAPQWNQAAGLKMINWVLHDGQL